MSTYIKAKASAVSRTTAKLMKTGQTTSYITGDDGDIEAGRNTDFTTLAENNVFGNTNRFTDELGTQTYTNNIVIDWSTYDGSTILGWYRVNNGIDINWAGAIAGALAFNISTFTTGWRLPNAGEFFSILYWGNFAGLLNYSPFNLTSTSTNYWTGTGSSTQAIRCNGIVSSTFNNSLKTTTTNYRYIPCRVFTVTGTTLS
jgi:hypothetical protein